MLEVSDRVEGPVAPVRLHRDPGRDSDAVRDRGVGDHDVGLADVLRWQRLPAGSLVQNQSMTFIAKKLLSDPCHLPVTTIQDMPTSKRLTLME